MNKPATFSTRLGSGINCCRCGCNDQLTVHGGETVCLSCIRAITTPTEGLKECRSVKVVVPAKMPTWNCLLAMNRWQRAKVRHSIHQLVSQSITIDAGCAIPMDLASRRRLMVSSIAAYCETIQPRKSRRSATSNTKSASRKTSGRKSRSRR